MYRRIVKLDDADRAFFVGDIHGEITKLNNKLDAIGFDKENDTLFSVGDLIDRGEDSATCLELIDKPWFSAVRGNHEQMMLDAINNPEDNDRSMHWFQNGGDWFYHMDKSNMVIMSDYAKGAISEMPHVIELHHRGKVIVICHADWPFDRYSHCIDAPEINILWSRERVEGRSESGVIAGADLFVFGHTPLRRPTKIHNQIYLDTGAVFGKELAVLSFDELFE